MSSGIRWLTVYAMSDGLRRFAFRLTDGQPRAKLRGTTRGAVFPSSSSSKVRLLAGPSAY